MEVKEWINTVVYLLPLAALVWKAAKMSATIEQQQAELKRLEVKHEDEKQATDSVIITLTAMLNDIKIAVTRIETKLEVKSDIQRKA